MGRWDLGALAAAMRELSGQVKRLADQNEPRRVERTQAHATLVRTDLSRIALKRRLFRAAKTDGLSNAQAKAKVLRILGRAHVQK